MTVNQRQKGARREREWARFLRDRLGCPDARRAAQLGVRTGRDVERGIPDTNAEVKGQEAFGPAAQQAAIDQAVRDAEPGEVPYVAHKRSMRPWTVTVRACDVVGLAARVRACEGQALPPAAPEDLLVTVPAEDLPRLAAMVAHIIADSAAAGAIGADRARSCGDLS